MHMKCSCIDVASSLAPCWCGKHVALTAEDCVTVFCDTRPEGAKGLFGVASTVHIVAGSITFQISVHGGEAAHLTALAGVLCPDTLGEAVWKRTRRKMSLHRMLQWILPIFYMR